MKKKSVLFLVFMTIFFCCCTKEGNGEQSSPIIELSVNKLNFSDEVKTLYFTLKSNADFWCFEEKSLSPVYGFTSAESSWFKVDPYCGKKGEYKIAVTAFDGTKNNTSTLNVVVDEKVVAFIELIQE